MYGAVREELSSFLVLAAHLSLMMQNAMITNTKMVIVVVRVCQCCVHINVVVLATDCARHWIRNGGGSTHVGTRPALDQHRLMRGIRGIGVYLGLKGFTRSPV